MHEGIFLQKVTKETKKGLFMFLTWLHVADFSVFGLLPLTSLRHLRKPFANETHWFDLQ